MFPNLCCTLSSFFVPSEIMQFILSWYCWTLACSVPERAAVGFEHVHRLSKHWFTVKIRCSLHTCMDVFSPPQIQVAMSLCPQVNTCRFKDVKDLCFGADDTWVTYFKPLKLKRSSFFICWKPDAACGKASPSELLQLCQWWLQKNRAVSPPTLRPLPKQGWLIICIGSKVVTDSWPSSFLLPQLKTTPLPSVISPFKLKLLFFLIAFCIYLFWCLWCHVFFFPADYHRLRVGGLILAAVLCLIGIMILLSKLEICARFSAQRTS